MLTTFDLDDYVYDALRAGASGFLLKSAPPQQLVAGDPHRRWPATPCSRPRSPAACSTASSHARRDPAGTPPDLAELTQRELEVLRLIADGRSNAEIAADLFLSEATVKTHVTRILTKLRLRDRVQAVVLAYRTGIRGRLHHKPADPAGNRVTGPTNAPPSTSGRLHQLRGNARSGR